MDLKDLRWLGRWVGVGAAAVGLCVGLGGCSRLQRKPADKYVYVTAKQTFLVDRVAAVSNRTGEVQNGEKLVVLGRARHWVQVRTPRGEVGWIKERDTAEQVLADQFEALRVKHLLDPTVASASARDDVYLHIGPGIQTERFFRLAEGDKLSLLQRAVVEKQVAPGAAVAKAAPAVAPKAGEAVEGPPPPPMEDWWLVRDAKGDTGWIYSHMIDVDAPDTLARYAEGQRIVAAYVLGHADDPESGILNGGVTVTSIPEYVTVLGPYKAGLPFDFDQVRVFTWNVKKHRYETAYREHDIAGYMPVVISQQKDPWGKSADAGVAMPAFTYKVLAEGAELPAPDPETGALKPAKLVEKTYRLEGNICRRILQPGTPGPAEFHLVVEEKKAGKKGSRK